MRALRFVACVTLVAIGVGGIAAIQAAPPGESALPVTLNVTVPENAEIWLEGIKTTSTGTVRQFVTPAMQTGKEYFYTMRVRYRQNNQDVDETRSLRVRAGDTVRLDYVAAPASSSAERAFYYTPDDSGRPYSRPAAPSYYSPRYRPPPYGINPPAGGPGTTW